MNNDEKPILISAGRIIVAFAVHDRPLYNVTLEMLMENTVEINQFYKVAELSVNIWMPEFILN